MDENKNPESRYDVDEEEVHTVLRAMECRTEDEEEGATTVCAQKI